MSQIYPILLAGGSGKRLWPLSRKSYPKQFSKFIGEKTLFQNTALRLTSSAIVRFAPHITLTNFEFRFIVRNQFQQININPGQILIEPEAKNTAASILAASMYLKSIDQDAILLVAPSDHVIDSIENFHNAISIGLSKVQNGKLVTFGVKPTRPETGYGYLKLSSRELIHSEVSDVIEFIEKPDLKHAAKMLQADNFYWNAGIFLFRAKDMVQAFETYAPNTRELVSKAVEDANLDLEFLCLSRKSWSMLDEISIDFAIMEKTTNLVAVPLMSRWSDVGGWDAVWSESKKDRSGNVVSKSAHAIKCSNSLLRSESSNQHVVGVGLENIMAIAMADAVLVAHKSEAQNVKEAVEILIKKDVAQAETFPKNHRPWGWFESLVLGSRFQVKRIFVDPGAALSLQSHNYRSEHWIVVEGTAKVTIDEDTKLVAEGQSIYVPLGAKHRLENPSKLPIILIEVQIGTYLGEDDIIRYEDIYARN
jgi:mannose-1-phosphate guanylyltransferase / mannose-6-phosphate isomerase